MTVASPMPIFTRTFDLLTWLVPVSNHFPRAHRFTVTLRPRRSGAGTGDRQRAGLGEPRTLWKHRGPAQGGVGTAHSAGRV